MARKTWLRRLSGAAGALGLVTALAGALIISSTTALAKNPGDFWLDNVGTLVNPGHVPHLDGNKDINLIASYPAGSGGTFTITAWQPTGDNKTVVYTGTWKYVESKGDPQVVGVIDVAKLIKNTHFTPHTQQGYHFKMHCTGASTNKTKEFWVTAPTVAPVVSPSPTPVTSPTPTGGVEGASITLAETGGPLLALGLLLVAGGGLGWLLSVRPGRRS